MNKWLENEPKITTVCVVISAFSLILSFTKVLNNFLAVDIAWIAIILCGIPILVGAAKGVILDHDIKADLLVSLALLASAGLGEYFAAGEVALIMQIGSLLEDYTSGKARESIEKLIGLTPQTARVIVSGTENIIPVEKVAAGDLLRVLPGETVPVDGTIIEGTTSIDQSVMTGESIPVDKTIGDSVSSGTINQFGAFTMRADAASENSALQRMVRLAREAEENKAPIVSAADRWATWLVLIALACAGITWAVTGQFIRAVTVLVVFCPCAFILATPTAVLAGIGNAAKYGIIIKSGDALERLSKIRRVAFDKTGTLTYGKLKVTEVHSVCDEYDDAGVLRLAALAEQSSEHPIGKAICRAYEDICGKSEAVSGFQMTKEAVSGLQITKEAVSGFQMTPGQGVSVSVDGITVLAGKEDYIRSNNISMKKLEQTVSQKGSTVIYVAADHKLAGAIALRDTMRDDARETLDKLKAIGITPMLLTGDNEYAAEAIAEETGISKNEVRSNLLPEEKMDIIKSMAGGDEPVCMVGDGVNDALALSYADAGIAMGGIGSDIAIESADAVLVSDEIRRLPYLFALMQKVMKKIQVNIAASLIINLTAVVLSAIGILNPVTGALWHNFGSVFVVVNAAMLLREKDQ